MAKSRRKNKTKRRNKGTLTAKGRDGRFITRQETADQARSTVIAARRRRMRVKLDNGKQRRLTADEAAQQDYGSQISMLFRNGEISQAQLDAANWWHDLKRHYKIAIGIKNQRDSIDFSMCGSSSRTPDEIDQANATVVSQYKRVRRVILETPDCPLADMALQTIVEEDNPAPKLVGDLRTVLNALSRLLKTGLAA